MNMRSIVAGVVLMGTGVASSWAGGVESLKAFITEVRSARTQFTQTVADANGKKIQDSKGTFQFARPGKFRWIYEKPYEQLIVGDGEKVWVYDKDLEQVSVKNLGSALGNSPAALLAGSNDVDQAYTFKALPGTGGLEWVEAVPKDPESSFEKMRVGFRKSVLEVMQLHDRLGQVTTIRFAKLERNPKLAPDVFKFTPPAGADVVGDR